MSDLFNYEGKRVVVTGGATGIGAALVELLRELGAEHITVLDIKKPEGPIDAYVEVNLADPASIDAACDQIEGRIDVLFSNAGVAANAGVRTCMAVNVLASRRLADELLDRMPEGAAIVYTASMAGNGWPDQLGEINELLDIVDWDEFLAWCDEHPDVVGDVYAFSKKCMQVFTMRNAKATMARGVRTNSICPAPVDTPLMKDFRETMGSKVIDWSVSQQGEARMAVAADMAPPLAFMGSDAAHFINGVNLLVDSGFTAAMTSGQVDFSALA